MRHIGYTYEALVKDLDQILEDMRAKHYVPELIVGISRGGLVPATALSYKLNVPLEVVKWQTRDAALHQDTWSLNKINETYAGKQVLIVDDIADSGLTLTQVSSRLKDCSVNYCTLVTNISGKVKPHFTGFLIDKNTQDFWIDFFWEK